MSIEIFKDVPLYGLSALKTLLRLATPNMGQQLFFAVGFAVLIWITGRIGTREMAAAHVLLSLGLLIMLPCLGLGLANATLIGQSLGRGEYESAKIWNRETGRVSLIFIGLAVLPLIIIPETLLSLFIHDGNTLEMARPLLRLTGFIFVFDGYGLIVMHGLLGAGHTMRVMIYSVILQWGFFLPLAYFSGPVVGCGLISVWLTLGVYRLLNALLFGLRWHGGEWLKIKV